MSWEWFSSIGASERDVENVSVRQVNMKRIDSRFRPAEGEKVENLITRLQGEREGNLQDVAGVESRLQMMLAANVVLPSVGPSQLPPPSPSDGLAGEEGTTGETIVSRDVVDQKGTGHKEGATGETDVHRDVVDQEDTGQSGGSSDCGQGSGPEAVDTGVDSVTANPEQCKQ
jgi:hypothetical protein